jgi:hypothetical protein
VLIHMHVAVQMRTCAVVRANPCKIHIDEQLWRQKMGVKGVLDIPDGRLNQLKGVGILMLFTRSDNRQSEYRDRKQDGKQKAESFHGAAPRSDVLSWRER